MSVEQGEPLAVAVESAASVDPRVTWSIHLRVGADDDLDRVAVHRPDAQLRTASVGKILLLIEVARRIAADPGYADRLLARETTPPIADSGVLQHLQVPELSIADLAVLVGAVSDNWATNVLLTDIGLASVAEAGRMLGLHDTRLLDQVRRPRTPIDPPALSYGTAAELSALMARLQAEDLPTPSVAVRVNAWLEAGVDLSMVASAMAFDPLTHAEDDRGLRLVNKTGTDNGIRADVGHLTGPAGHAAYAVLANWDPTAGDRRDVVLAAMREIGQALRTSVTT